MSVHTNNLGLLRKGTQTEAELRALKHAIRELAARGERDAESDGGGGSEKRKEVMAA